LTNIFKRSIIDNMTEPSVSQFFSVAEAVSLLDSTPVSPKSKKVSLADAQGLRLAQDIFADRDAPPFDKSLMDGYAVQCNSLQNPMQLLQIVGEIAAGKNANFSIFPGQAVAIMTGAALPNGADGVVPVEDAECVGGNQLRVLRPTAPGRYIARRGSDCGKSDLVLARGTLLQSAQLAVAASVGASSIDVYPPPRAAILCTGDELVAIDQAPGPWQIRNSNEIMLVSLLKSLGCDVTTLGTAIDDPQHIRDRIIEGMKFDAFFITGGMSMGTYDFVPKILQDLNVDIQIAKLRIKPGKPFVFGVSRNGDRPCYVFGLPGNPVSGYVCTLRLAARILRRLAGGPAESKWIHAPLLTALPPNGPREFYQPAKVEQNGISPLQWKGSADIFTLARATALLVREENEPARQPGEIVRCLEI